MGMSRSRAPTASGDVGISLFLSRLSRCRSRSSNFSILQTAVALPIDLLLFRNALRTKNKDEKCMSPLHLLEAENHSRSMEPKGAKHKSEVSNNNTKAECKRGDEMNFKFFIPTPATGTKITRKRNGRLRPFGQIIDSICEFDILFASYSLKIVIKCLFNWPSVALMKPITQHLNANCRH